MLYRVLGSLALLLALLIVAAWNIPSTVRIEHTFSSPPADVWRIWNDPGSIQKWWGPKGHAALVVRNDLRPGGSYLWAMKSAQGKMFWSTGTYQEIVPGRKIMSTMSFCDQSGKMVPSSKVSVPGRWPNEITVIVELSEFKGKSTVTVTEVGIPLIAYPLSKIGWAQQFDKIQSLL